MGVEEFVAHARSLKGARWRHMGRKPWAVDCLGLLELSIAAAGRPVETPVRYGREPWDDALRRGLREQFGEPVCRPWVSGDVPLIRWRAGDPSHVAVIADHPDGGLSMIHAHNIHGVVEHSLSGPYLDVIVEVYRPWPVKSSR